MAKKMTNFLGHCFLSPQIAWFSSPEAKRQGYDLAKLRFLGQIRWFPLLKFDHPQRFVSISEVRQCN